MKIKLSKYATQLLEVLKDHLQAENSDVIEQAIINLYENYLHKGEITEDGQSLSLMEALDKSGYLKRSYKCFRNALPAENREEYLIEAENDEDAWQQMAKRFPREVRHGFTVEEIEPIDFDNSNF